MAVQTDIQIVNEKCRALYETEGSPVLLQQIAQIYRITIREWASTFGTSKANAEEVMKHKKLPSLEIAIRMTRFFGCTVEELFGWRFDDDGKRRPLLRWNPQTKKFYRLREQNPAESTMAIVWDVLLMKAKADVVEEYAQAWWLSRMDRE